MRLKTRVMTSEVATEVFPSAQQELLRSNETTSEVREAGFSPQKLHVAGLFAAR